MAHEHASFYDLATHLVGYHPPKDPATAMALGHIREAFAILIETVEGYLPESAETTLAARAIHDACQRCIAAVILNQD